MIYKKETIGMAMAVAALASVLLAGIVLAPIQAAATSQHSKSNPQFNNFNSNSNENTNTAKSKSTSGFTDTASLKDSIRDGVTVKLEQKSQHMNQENLCYRANICRQSNVGQNTLGNDNQVTGFADQSDNIQQAANLTANNNTSPTPNPSPTPTPTPLPTPISVGCPAGTIFDVTLQAALGTLPAGTVLCLNTAGLNTGITAILSGGTTVTATVTIALPLTGTCPTGSVVALVTSGTLPLGLSGISLCVSL